MLQNEICHAGHAALAQFHVVVVADLVQSISGWKVLSWELAEFPANVCTNVLTIWWVEPYDFSFSRSSLCPLLRMTSSYFGVAFANFSWLHVRLERRFTSIVGNCFLIMGGWLDWLCTYNGELLGLRNGQYFPDCRFRVTSKKFVSTKLVSAVIFKSFIFFVVRSAVGPDAFFNIARPSSR